MGVVVLAADQLTKSWATASLQPGKETTVIAGWVWFALRRNSGATLGFLSGHNQLLGALSLIIVGALVLLGIGSAAGGTTGALALGAIAGGALANVVDRVRMGAVTDFIEIHLWPTDFNLADAAIRLGVVVFLLSLLLQVMRRPARHTS